MTNETAPAAALANALAPRLALLRAVAATGNLTNAAHQLDMPQPTVSRWLAGLSTDLGAPVVVREGRGIRLSRAGECLAQAAAEALAVLECGCRRAIEEIDPDRGQVAFAFLNTMSKRVPELLRAFHARYPAVRFVLVQAAHEQMLAHLRAGRVDLVLTSPPPPTDEFEHVILYTQPLVAAVPAGHKLAGRRRVRIAELAAQPLVGMKPGYGMRGITDELFRNAGHTAEFAFEGEEVETLRGLVAAGLGVAVLPASETTPSGMVEIPLAPKANRQIGLVWPARRALSPTVRRFRDFAIARREVTNRLSTVDGS